jgi:hypothetical protein
MDWKLASQSSECPSRLQGRLGIAVSSPNCQIAENQLRKANRVHKGSRSLRLLFAFPWLTRILGFSLPQVKNLRNLGRLRLHTFPTGFTQVSYWRVFCCAATGDGNENDASSVSQRELSLGIFTGGLHFRR